MRFGLFTGALRTDGRTHQESYREFIDYVRRAEELGFESVFLVEHHFTGLGDVSASMNLLSHLAGVTTTMRLGTAVSVLPWHSPVLLAEQAATVDVVSNGRLDFGVGRGYRPNEFHGFGIDPAEALDRYRECLEVIKLAWTSQERFSHSGAHFTFQDVVVEPKPVQLPHPPVWVAAGSEGSIRAAAREGNRLLLDQFGDDELVAARVRWFREECEATGRGYDPHDVAVTRGLLVLDDDDPEVRRAEVERRVDSIAQIADSSRIPGSTSHLDTNDHAFFDRSTVASEAAAILGPPEECIERLSRLRAAGVEYVLFNDMWGGTDRLELFARDVMPHLS